MTDETKRCLKCKVDKPTSEFHRDRRTADGFCQHCRKCRAESWANAVDRGGYGKRRRRDTMPGVPVMEVGENPKIQSPVIETVEEQLTNVEEHRLRGKARWLNDELIKTVDQLSHAQALLDIVQGVSEGDVPPIRPREKGTIAREATALVMASDWHVEEEVRPESVAFRNVYNLEIATRRMERFFEATRWSLDFCRGQFLIRDMVLWLGGDFITNYLHDDNRETNLLAPPEALTFIYNHLITGIQFLLKDDKLERLVIPCNDGNHGRMNDVRRPRVAARTQTSLETMLYRMLAARFADEPRVRFIIAEGVELYYEIYGRTVRFTHGDAVNYGGGVGGITIPINKAVANWDTIRQAELTCMGHWHQRICLPNLMVNGSLIGHSPYSVFIKARFYPPSQNFRILDAHRFSSVDVPLWVGDRSDDLMLELDRAG